MSKVDLDAIQARADAATPGPWTPDIRETWAEPGDYDAVCWGDNLYTLCAVPGPTEQGAANTEFIARAREDVPALVAELRIARAFERFIREYAITPYVRALTLVENWDRLVAAGDAYPGSEESSR